MSRVGIAERKSAETDIRIEVDLVDTISIGFGMLVAVAALGTAVERAADSGRALDHAGSLEDAAKILALCQRAAEARALLAQAIDRYEAIGARSFAARSSSQTSPQSPALILISSLDNQCPVLV